MPRGSLGTQRAAATGGQSYRLRSKGAVSLGLPVTLLAHRLPNTEKPQQMLGFFVVSEGGLELSSRAPAPQALDLRKRGSEGFSCAPIVPGLSCAFLSALDRCGSCMGHVALTCPEARHHPPTYRRTVDFNITTEEERLLFVIVSHLDAGNTPTVDELSAGAGHDARPTVLSLSQKGWLLLREVDDQSASGDTGVVGSASGGSSGWHPEMDLQMIGADSAANFSASAGTLVISMSGAVSTTAWATMSATSPGLPQAGRGSLASTSVDGALLDGAAQPMLWSGPAHGPAGPNGPRISSLPSTK